jgi:hypothetical protein
MELVDVPWNPFAVRDELHRASTILSERGLKLSAKWAIEQWMGLSVPPSSASGGVEDGVSAVSAGNLPPHDADGGGQLFSDLEWKEASPIVHYARVLMDLGEYGHAASVLSRPSTSKSLVERCSMPPPLPDLSPAALYVRAYSLYMDGERRKEEDGQHVEQLLRQQRCVVCADGLPVRSTHPTER